MNQVRHNNNFVLEEAKTKDILPRGGGSAPGDSARIGLVHPRLIRPFTEAKLRKIMAGKWGVAVIDQNLSLGKGGVLCAELASALYGQKDAPVLTSFIGGLGGRDITPEEFYEIAAITRQAAQIGIASPPRLLYTEGELREVRKLQTVAQVEKQRLGEDK